jgi:hypothetical protein
MMIDPLSILLNLDEMYELKKYKREDNWDFCDKYENELRRLITNYNHLPAERSIDWARAAFNSNCTENKYRSVSFCNLMDADYEDWGDPNYDTPNGNSGPKKNGWVEFRIPGGKNYHYKNKWNKVRESIAHYVDCVRKSISNSTTKRNYNRYNRELVAA